MARNRIIYQSQALYAGPKKDANGSWRHETGTEEPKQLHRIQSVNYNFDIARQDVNQFGNLAAIDRIVLESPTVGLDFSWYVCSFYNEQVIGLKVDNSLSSCLTDILDNNAGERNYYVRVVKDGSDVNNNSATLTGDGTQGSTVQSTVIGIGNGFLSSYTLEGAVGGLPTASANVEALNMRFMHGTGAGDSTKAGNETAYHYAPHVNPSDGAANTSYVYSLHTGMNHAYDGATTALKPGDVSLTIPDPGGGVDIVSDQKIQSFNISFDMAREPINKLGSRFAFAREITFPITVTMSCDAIVGDFKTGALSNIIDLDSSHDITVEMKKGSSDHIAAVLKGAKLDSQSFSASIGDNKTATLSWSSQIGSSAQTDVGLFLSGSAVE
tara:strand:+ start:6609 stop:7757 length:1149 start_codon:yes stop_codon:yes gene_type:complete